MKISALAILLFSTAALTLTSCKPKEEATVPPAPAVPAAPTKPAGVTNAAASIKADLILSPTEAKDHIGEEATVKGKVFGVHVTAKGDVFINVGAAYPNAPFTAVCFQGAIPADDLKALDGKTVSFTGKIKDHNGQTEIILNKADQIKTDEAKPDAARIVEVKTNAVTN